MSTRDVFHLQYTLDEQGEPKPCDDFLAWADWFENIDNRRLALDKVGDTAVSTVFLGLDHAADDGPPQLWESAIITDGGIEVVRRYRSREAALAGHAELVAGLKG